MLYKVPRSSQILSQNSSPHFPIEFPLQSLNLTSPAHSTASNDLDYMDGSISGTSNNSTAYSSPSKSAASASSSRASAGKKNAFMKTISGIFNRSSSLSSVSRQGQPDVVAEASQQASVRFPRLNVGFNRSSSVHREANKKVGSPPSEGKAPKAEISELGSLGSLASNSTTSTPLRRPANNHSALGVIGVGMAAGSMFQVRVIKFETNLRSISCARYQNAQLYSVVKVTYC